LVSKIVRFPNPKCCSLQPFGFVVPGRFRL